jgi:hypothetical protein
MELWKIGARLRYLHGRTPSCQPGDIETLIKELDPIGSGTSYPYLRLARHVGAAYGDVLWFADFLQGGGNLRISDVRVHGALERLNNEQREAIMRVVHDRRAKS